MNTMNNIVGERIRNMRKSLGLNQQQLVEMLLGSGIVMQVCTLCKIELGHRQVSDIELKAFADALQTSISSFFG
ncbi:MAG: helix-turn-helix transcriptional regulator [Ruminococcaceae bacterium]|nr:helix-turn-helix transcriptional regulator [Oscillospiraceae bacterium]